MLFLVFGTLRSGALDDYSSCKKRILLFGAMQFVIFNFPVYLLTHSIRDHANLFDITFAFDTSVAVV